MSKSIEKIILDQAANYAAKLATNSITVFLKRWRFYFDESDRAKLNEEVKKMLLEVIKNATNRN